MPGVTDVHLLLDIYRERASELRAEAAAERLARAMAQPGPLSRFWHNRRHVGGPDTPALP